jgi:hypothetical protein
MFRKPAAYLTAILFSTFLLFSQCKTISGFDQYAYAQGTALKVDAINIMGKATKPYASQLAGIEDVSTRIEKAYEYEKHRPKNLFTVKMWEIVKSPDHNLFGGFIKRWKEKDTLSAAFINEAKKQVGEAFDMIVELESKKIKSDDPGVSSFFSANQ